ncbi:CFI-box-CTERM domain-containing protein [Acidobacteriota bacterium]
MTRKLLIIIFLLSFACSLTLNAQWAKTYGGIEDDYGSSILQTFDGGYIVVGNTLPNRFDEYIGILKLNMLGDIEWQNTYAGEINSLYPSFIQQTNEGGYIYGGSTRTHCNIIKLSVDGDIEWQKFYAYEFGISINILLQTNDGTYIIVGENWISLSRDIVILKVSVDGAVEWTKTYGESSFDDQAYSIQQTNEGGYIIAGQTNSFGEGEYDIWILKLASDGTNEWQKTYGGSEGEYAYSIQKTNDGGYIIAGATQSFGAGNSDFLILKLSHNGTIEWQKTYGGSLSEVAYSIQQTFDGGYVVAGTTMSFGAGNVDLWILKLDILGILEWQKTYGGSKEEEVKSIQQTIDGGYIVGGSTYSYGMGERDFLILKLFPNGDINSSCGMMSDSNAEVSDTYIIPANTGLIPEDIVLGSKDALNTRQEGKAVSFSLCSGQHTLNITTSSGGTTVPQPGTYIFDHAERIDLSANPDEGYIFVGWSGDITSTDALLSITMDSDKSVKANFSEDVIEDIIEDVKKAPCFIVTAAFGSPLHPYVITLQDFRDKYLMSNKLGRMFVKLYYKYSPHIAELITNHKALRTVVRIWLVPFVAMGYSMVHFGLIKTTMMLVFSIMPLFFFVRFYMRRSKRG